MSRLASCADRGAASHARAWIRDVPADCTCRWSPRYPGPHGLTSEIRYVRTGNAPGCPWHLTGS